MIRKRSVTGIFTVLALGLVLFPCAVTAQSGVTAHVDAVFADWDHPDTPGCALAVVRDGEVIYTRGYGMADLEHDVPITPESVFYLCSESKQFVTASMLLLEEDGKLSIDDDVRDYIPELPDYGSVITIRHLIHHTSGLRDIFELWALAGEDYLNYHTPDETLAMIVRQKELNFMPGEKRMYCNSGYFLLSVIVERVSGMSLREYADCNVLRPLGMTGSHFHDDPSMIVKNRAYGHMPHDGGGWEIWPMRFALVGSGGLYTSVLDLAKWDRVFYDNPLGRNGQAFIERMKTRARLNSGEVLDYAFALVLGEYRGLETIRHGGALGGYRTHMLRFPGEHFTVITLFNTGSVNPAEYAERVADIYLADRMAPKPEPNEPATAEDDDAPEFTPSRVDLASCAGTYDSTELGSWYTVTVRDGSLEIAFRDAVKETLVPVGRDSFKTEYGTFRFMRDAYGDVTGIAAGSSRISNITFTKRR